MRIPSGFTQDTINQPLGGLGTPNPFFYAVTADDFLPYQAAKYTVTAASGSVAQTQANGSGGRILMTTGAVAADFAEIQGEAFGHALTLGRKAAFLTQLNLADITNSSFLAGMISVNATPFTAVADGIYFLKAVGSTVLQLLAVTAGVVVGTTTLTGALTAGQDVGLGFYVNPQGEILGYVGQNLVGPYTQTGPDLAIRSPSGALTTAALGATLAVSAGTAVAQTMVADFLLAATER
jgi:hypothetical protein